MCVYVYIYIYIYMSRTPRFWVESRTRLANLGWWYRQKKAGTCSSMFRPIRSKMEDRERDSLPLGAG